MKVAEWSNEFYQRLVTDVPGLVASATPDEDEHYTCTLPEAGHDLFVMGCDECFAAVWLDGIPVCDYSKAVTEDAVEAASHVADLLRRERKPE